jgi:hypothetical protein
MTAPRLPDAALVGRGYTSDVYAWGVGRVLKLFHRSFPRANAKREYRVTRAVHAAGLPAPAAYFHKHGLTRVSDLLADLNQARKGTTYGDEDEPDLEPDDVLQQVKDYLREVESFLRPKKGK